MHERSIGRTTTWGRRAGAAVGTAALAAGLTTGLAGLAASPAAAEPAAMCQVESRSVQSTSAGTNVWLPTDWHWKLPGINPTGWQEGGSQTVSKNQGRQQARSFGNANEHGVGVEVGVPDAGSLSYSYNSAHNRETGVSWSTDKSYSVTRAMPQGEAGRLRVYQAGVRFTYTFRVRYTAGPACKDRTYQRSALFPLKTKQTAMLVERYSKRGQAISR